MSFTDPPAILTQLRTQLAACAGWANGSGAVHYPDLPALAGATFPLAVVAESSRTFDTYADGALPLGGGSMQVVVYATGSVGVVEELGRTILSQLLAQFTGIPFRPSECGLSSDPSPAKVAGASEYRAVTLTIGWGLNG
ncbi:hypothetical protein [Methylibium sp.]|uniref:hypothetical protein n=1 Tax=Methylibium sp. TaxID=2067992 RepID=UPI00183F0EEF|nr:hypothetical protein [Methylibium sp.]MBA3591563.1 hypothetical protein [Methylibium sp.]